MKSFLTLFIYYPSKSADLSLFGEFLEKKLAKVLH